jgi:hypothetical protein
VSPPMCSLHQGRLSISAIQAPSLFHGLPSSVKCLFQDCCPRSLSQNSFVIARTLGFVVLAELQAAKQPVKF